MYPSWKNDDAFRVSSKIKLNDQGCENDEIIEGSLNSEKYNILKIYESLCYLLILISQLYLIDNILNYLLTIYSSISLCIIQKKEPLLLFWFMWIIIDIVNIINYLELFDIY